MASTLRTLLTYSTRSLTKVFLESTSRIIKIYAPIGYPDFTNVSRTSISGTLLRHSAATLRINAESLFMLLILKASIYTDAMRTVELLHKPTSAASSFSSIVIVVRYWTAYSPVLLTLASLSSRGLISPSSNRPTYYCILALSRNFSISRLPFLSLLSVSLAKFFYRLALCVQ